MPTLYPGLVLESWMMLISRSWSRCGSWASWYCHSDDCAIPSAEIPLLNVFFTDSLYGSVQVHHVDAAVGRASLQSQVWGEETTSVVLRASPEWFEHKQQLIFPAHNSQTAAVIRKLSPLGLSYTERQVENRFQIVNRQVENSFRTTNSNHSCKCWTNQVTPSVNTIIPANKTTARSFKVTWSETIHSCKCGKVGSKNV